MKRKHLAIALPLAMLLAMSCKEEKKPENIIVKKTPVAVKKSVQSMGDNAAERDVEWLGATYHIRIERKADKSLSLAKDGQGNKYYDNRVSTLRFSLLRAKCVSLFRVVAYRLTRRSSLLSTRL